MPEQHREEPGNSPRSERWQRMRQDIKQRWEDRPSLLEIQYIHLPMALLLGAFAVGVADEVLDTHLAETMAHVRVDPNESFIERTLDSVVHEIGTLAVEEE